MTNKELIKLWEQGHKEGASFPVGMPTHTPHNAAIICGMRNIEQITPDGGVRADNKWGTELVILNVAGKGPMAVDVSFQKIVNFSKKFLGLRTPRFQPLPIEYRHHKQTSRPSSDSRDGLDRVERDDKSPNPDKGSIA